MPLRQQIIAEFRKRGQDTIADALEAETPFEDWPDAMKIEYDKAIYGTAFTLDGKRIDPTKVTIHPGAKPS